MGFFIMGFLVVVLALLAGGFYIFTVLAPVEAQLPNNAVPIIVNLTQPFNSDNVSLTNYNTVRANAIGDTPIQLMQLWVDGVAVDAHAANLTGSTYTTEFSWLPTGPGDHTLLVVAVDTNGQSVNSNLVQVKAFPSQPELLDLETGEGDTLQNVAQAFDLTTEQMAALNPQITTAADQPLPAGTILTVLPPAGAPAISPPIPRIPPDTSLLPAAPPPPAGPVAAAPALPTNNPVGTFTQLVVAPAASRPAAPLLTTDVNGCTVTLNFTDQASDEVGFLVYRASPGSTTFVKIAALNANSNAGTTLSFSEPGRYGRSMYFVSAFNGAGESQSLPAQATIFSQTCVQPDQVGLAVKSPTITTANPLDRAFCYASLDNGPWTRMPQGVETYVYPVNGVFDFSKDLNTLISPPPTVAVTLTMRCGGFAGDLLIDLGVGQQSIQPNSNNQPFQLTGQGFTLTATLNFGQTQVPPPPLLPPAKVVRAQTPERVIPPPFDVAIFPAETFGELNMMWRWRPVICVPDANGNQPADCQYVSDITGYKVYRLTGTFEPVLVKGDLTPDQKLLKLTAPADDVSAECYIVVVYKNELNSDASMACYGNPNYPTPSLFSGNISAPTNLRLTSDINECLSHQAAQPATWGDQDCQKITGTDGRAIVWDWSNTVCVPGTPGCEAITDIDGYNIYQVTRSREQLVAAVRPGTTTAVVVLSGPEWTANCFMVRAFMGNLESGNSNELCLSPAEFGLTNFALNPTATYRYGSYFNNRTGCVPETSRQVDAPETGSRLNDGALNVGYIHRTFTNAVASCTETAAFWREGVVSFDLSTLAGRTIQKAAFAFRRGQAQNLWDATQTFEDGFLDMGLNSDNDCATSLRTDVSSYGATAIINGIRSGRGGRGRHGTSMYVGAVEVAPAPLGTGPIDVTALANQVLADGLNDLQFLFATDQTHPAETKSCFSNYFAFKLEIQLAP
jgi:hypothetical protein